MVRFYDRLLRDSMDAGASETCLSSLKRRQRDYARRVQPVYRYLAQHSTSRR